MTTVKPLRTFGYYGCNDNAVLLWVGNDGIRIAIAQYASVEEAERMATLQNEAIAKQEEARDE